MSSFCRFASVSIVMAVGCGGSTSGDVGGGSGDNGATGASSGDTTGAGSGTTSAAGANGGGSGTVVGLSGTNGGGTAGDTSATGANGGGSTGTMASSGTAGASTGTPATGPGQVACGTATCEGATPVCCVDARGSSCAASSADCATDAGRTLVVLTCTGKASCTNGDVCCLATIRPDGGRAGTGEAVTECAAECGNDAGRGGEQVCTVDGDCATGDTCVHVGGAAAAAYGVCVPGRVGGLDGGGRPVFDGGRPVFDGGRPVFDGGRPVFDGGGRRPRDASTD